MQTRRDFLNTAWMGAAALAAGGCVTKWCGAPGGAMATYADKPIRNLRVGVVGLGRGQAGITGFTLVPGSGISAICDIDAGKCASTLKYLADAKADNRGRSVDIPDFTRGAWKTTKPLGLVDVDLKKIGFTA